MPNGGSDCCMNCTYNIAVQKLGRFPKGTVLKKKEKEQEEWRALSECSLRKVNVNFTSGTFCANFRRIGEDAIPVPVVEPIYAEGYTEKKWTYPRIPWNGNYEVFLVGRELLGDKVAVCNVCERVLENGLIVRVSESDVLAFCCNAHYMRWWFDCHPEEELAYSYHELHDPDAV